MLTDCLQQHFARGQVPLAGDLAEDLSVFVIVEVMSIRIEDAVTPQSIRLMYLEINADRSHGSAWYPDAAA